MNYLAVILVFVIVILLYMFYSYLTNTSLTSGLQKLVEPLTFGPSKLDKPGSATYSYQCWLFINDVNSAGSIFYRKGTGTNATKDFDVSLNANTLTINAGTSSSGPNTIMTVTTEFPLQKWVYLVINVYTSGTVEAYINGKLIKTVKVDATAIKPKALSPLTVGGGGPKGYVTKFTRLSKTLNAETVQKNYFSGNGISTFFSSMIPYGLTMAISKGEEVQRSIKVF